MVDKVFLALGNGIRNIEKVFSYIGIVCLILMMFLGAADVIGRFVFNSPIKGAMEWSQMLQVGVVFMGLAYTQATDSHVKVDLFFRRYPQSVKIIISFITLVLTTILFAVIVWQSTVIAISDLRQNRLIETILIPIFPFKLLVPIGASFLCLECIIQIIYLLAPFRNIKEAKGGL